MTDVQLLYNSRFPSEESSILDESTYLVNIFKTLFLMLFLQNMVFSLGCVIFPNRHTLGIFDIFKILYVIVNLREKNSRLDQESKPSL